MSTGIDTTSSPTDPSKDAIVMEATMTTESGVVVPMKVTIEYPKGYGMFAVHLLTSIPESGMIPLRQSTGLDRDEPVKHW